MKKLILVLIVFLVNASISFAETQWILPFADSYMGYVYDRLSYKHENTTFTDNKNYSYSYSANIYFDLVSFYNGNELPKFKEKDIVFLVFNFKYTDKDIAIETNNINNKYLPDYRKKSNQEYKPIIEFRGIVTREYIPSKPSGLYKQPKFSFKKLYLFPSNIDEQRIMSALKYNTYDYSEPYTTKTKRFSYWEGNKERAKTVSIIQLLEEISLGK